MSDVLGLFGLRKNECVLGVESIGSGSFNLNNKNNKQVGVDVGFRLNDINNIYDINNIFHNIYHNIYNFIKTNFISVTQLNGNNGEFTNGDDVRTSGRKYRDLLLLICTLSPEKYDILYQYMEQKFFARQIKLDLLQLTREIYYLRNGVPDFGRSIYQLTRYEDLGGEYYRERGSQLATWIVRFPIIASDLNGNNGEWTNSDDVDYSTFYTNYQRFLRRLDDVDYFNFYNNYQRFLRRLNKRVNSNIKGAPLIGGSWTSIQLIFFALINVLEIFHWCLSLTFQLYYTYIFWKVVYLLFTHGIYWMILFPVKLLINDWRISLGIFVIILLFRFDIKTEKPPVQEVRAPEPTFPRREQEEITSQSMETLNSMFRDGEVVERCFKKERRFVTPQGRILRGGGGGKSMTGKINKKGKAGSKSKGDVQPRKEDVQKGKEVSQKDDGVCEVAPIGLLDKKTYSDFVYSAPPDLKCRLTRNELAGEKIIFDCFGAPFCGMVCVDIAAGIKPDLEEYLFKVQNQTNILDCGTDEYLVKYAASRGYNLAISHDAATDIYPTNPCWNYIMLRFEPGEGEQGEKCGHYKLCLVAEGSSSSVTTTGLPVGGFQNKSFFFGLLNIITTFRVIGVLNNPTDKDRRQVVSRRDPVEEIEKYCNLGLEHKIMLGLGDSALHICDVSEISFKHLSENLMGRFNRFLNELVTVHFDPLMDRLDDLRDDVTVRRVIGDFSLVVTLWMYLVYELKDQVLKLTRYHGLFRTLDYVIYPIMAYFINVGEFPSELVISLTKVKRVISDAECCEPADRLKSISLLGSSRFIQDDWNMGTVLLNSVYYLKLVLPSLKAGMVRFNPVRVAVNANTCHSIIPNVQIVRVNQANGKRGGGVLPKHYYNHVKSSKISTIKRNVPVAVCPTISFHNSGKQLGPGNVCVTDSVGELTGFMRSMSRNPEEVDDWSYSDFANFAIKFIDKIVLSTDVSSIKEIDCREYFRKHYTGKKPKKYIEGVIRDYNEYLQGRAKRDFLHNKCFVKLENSQKLAKNKVHTRPRLIMVMNQRLLVEYCQVIDVINQWNDSAFSKFQIKHMSEQEMMDKVCRNMDRKHIVTDYSSFECSISNDIRKLESYAIWSLLKKSGLTIARQRYLSDCEGARILKTKDNTFSLNSRNSGDFHTSWMNGLQNVLLSAYCYSKEHPEDVDFVRFDMVAEGDDGIRAPGKRDVTIVKNLGFSFSVAVEGQQPGDVDFLRVRWLKGKRYLSVGRALKIAWVSTNGYINHKKAKAIQRCSALSLHYMSPGHPILWAICKRIAAETSGSNYFKGLENIMQPHKKWNSFLTEEHIKMTGSNFGDFCKPDESMRAAVAEGTTGFPPIPISVQLMLEDSILNGNGNINLFGLLDEYDDVKGYLYSDEWMVDHHMSKKKLFSEDVQEVLKIVQAKTHNMKTVDHRKVCDQISDNFSKSLAYSNSKNKLRAVM